MSKPMFPLRDLFDRVEREHKTVPAGHDAESDIAQFQSRSGFKLPDDLAEFYRRPLCGRQHDAQP
ncbi:MAG TPA: SMI1/KNR4 family protein [Candidatus Obscuribacterales bacterium]